MKIISKFQDYYDCGVAYGIDEKIYFKRETTKAEIKETKNPKNRTHQWINSSLAKLETSLLSIGKIYFCGKVYNYKLRKKSKTGKAIRTDAFNRDTADYKFYYTIEQYREDYPEKKDDKKYQWRVSYTPDDYFKVKEVPDDEFIERGVPYFIWDTNLPVLKEYQFTRAVPPMVAFQEISMYLGRLNHKENECEIDEKFRKAGHGMDCTSFRKEGKKKQKCKDPKDL